MAAVRRTSSRLASRPSPYSAGVTLFKLEDLDDADFLPPPATPRSQKYGVKKEEEDTLSMDALITLEYEDLKPLSPSKRSRSANSSPASSPGPSSSPKKTRSKKTSSPKKSPSKATSYKKALSQPDPAPARWREVFNAIQEMRKGITAPVDTMGCHMAQRHETDSRNKRYENHSDNYILLKRIRFNRFITLVSLMLSPQARDDTVDPAVTRLRDLLGGTLSLENMLAADENRILKTIRPVGLGPGKTRNLKAAAEQLRDRFNGDIPQTLEEIVTLPGVGPKVGLLALQNAWNINAGIGVDTHVLRITRLLGWHKFPKEKVEHARVSLESWLPKEHWREINPLLVGFGQTICKSDNPLCGQCTLSASGLCPSARKTVPLASPRKGKTKGKQSSPSTDCALNKPELGGLNGI
ncbi:ENDO3c domain-containing protein [Mycena chlorophos]|uniref:Endonuclease III homolog n=1 Tax=Mycena chlorophos TaxID=658473 RepID=A0A8H6TUU9_MYCCL|nr:ENDO3c domain-containing protein [Mycena chlorophos]